MNLIVESGSNIKATRKRATRSITKKMKDINSFIVMCVEEYASEVNKPSEIVYKEMKKYGLIKYLEEFYEEMHAMSFQYINQEIDEVLKNKRYLY